MPSLPSIPGFEDSNENVDPSSDGGLNDSASQLPIHSTPAVSRMRSSSSSATRLANSLGRSSSASRLSSRQSQLDNLDASPILHTEGNFQDDEDSKESVPEVYLPPEDLDEFSIADALQSIDSPYNDSNSKKQRYSDYSDYVVPLRPEPQVSATFLVHESAFTQFSPLPLTSLKTSLYGDLSRVLVRVLHLLHERRFPLSLPHIPPPIPSICNPLPPAQTSHLRLRPTQAPLIPKMKSQGTTLMPGLWISLRPISHR